MADMRMNLVKSLENILLDYLEPDEINEVSDKMIIMLGDCEITKSNSGNEAKCMSNENIISLYRGGMTVDGKSANTIYQYIRIINKLCEFVKKPITEMSVYDIRYFLASEKERGVSERSVENFRSYLSSFFTWLINEEIIQKNPMRNIKPITYKDEVKKPFTEVEIDKLRSACRTTKERAIIEMLLATGVRVSELTHMEVSDIMPSEFKVYVKHGKGGNSRITYVTPVALEHLNKYLNERPEKDGTALFYNKNHEVLRPGGIRYILHEIAKRSGVTNTYPHNFRKFFACTLSKRGMDIHEIQKLMGHKKITTTLCYIYTEDEQVKASYRKYVS